MLSVKHAVELEPGEKRPDVFDDAYKKFVTEEVEKWVVPYKDNPWILGYYYGFGSFMRDYEWLSETLRRGVGSPGGEHLWGIMAISRSSIPSMMQILNPSMI